MINNSMDYNIISIGDHCAIPMILKELNLRQNSYPFDWVAKRDHLYVTNILENLSLINELNTKDNVDNIVKKFFGNAFENTENDKTNAITDLWFPHDTENVNDVFEKYKRRFTRLKSHLNKKNIFVLVTRIYHIEKDIFQKIIDQLLGYNSDSIILFISGTDHTYFKDMKNDNVIFKYVYYDVSKFYGYDYSAFRPNIKKFLSNLLS